MLAWNQGLGAIGQSAAARFRQSGLALFQALLSLNHTQQKDLFVRCHLVFTMAMIVGGHGLESSGQLWTTSSGQGE